MLGNWPSLGCWGCSQHSIADLLVLAGVSMSLYAGGKLRKGATNGGSRGSS